MKVLSAVTTLIASLAGSPCGLGLRVFFTSVVGLIMAVTAAQYAVAESSYKNSKAIFSIYQDPNNLPTLLREPGCGRGQNNALSADIGVVEFGDDGSFIDSDQLKLILECISGARQKSPNGVVVLVFVHGWRHDSSWNDENFRDFRTVIFSLALREAERVGGRFRRVVGVYFGWSGGRITEFGKRYQVAQRIGQGGPIQKAIQDIVRTAKEASANEQLGSPVILAGHSMGALMLQTAFSSLLDANGIGLREASSAEQGKCSRVREGNRVVSFPDLVLLLNSATDSQITKKIVGQLNAKQLSKTVDCGFRSFSAPLFISASSKNDYATQWAFWAATFGRRKTDGNDDDLINYRLVRGQGSLCPAIRGLPDYGQSWHCLRQPEIENNRVVSINIDLPQTEGSRDACHRRYRFEQAPDRSTYSPLWVFQVPPDLMNGHTDIFNGRSSLLVMALIQLSGATMSVHQEYVRMFEGESGSCVLQ